MDPNAAKEGPSIAVDRLKGILPVPEVIPWWNVERIG